MTFREILKKNAEGRVTYMASSCGYEFKYKGQMLGTQAGEWVGWRGLSSRLVQFVMTRVTELTWC